MCPMDVWDGSKFSCTDCIDADAVDAMEVLMSNLLTTFLRYLENSSANLGSSTTSGSFFLHSTILASYNCSP